MTKVTFIRHAQSTFNAYGDQSPDVPITDHGRTVANEQLHGHYSLVVCSTLLRAKQPLEASRITYDTLVFTDDCRETLDGNPANCKQGEDPATIETPEQLAARSSRLGNALLEHAKTHDTIAVVSHYCFIASLCGHGLANCGQLEVTLVKQSAAEVNTPNRES